MFSKSSITTQEFKNLDNDHIDKLKKIVNYDYEEKKLIEQTNCLITSDSVFFLLTGKSAFFSQKNASLISADIFFKKEVYSTQDLFTQSEASEHSVFHIEFAGNAHALVIEKNSHKKRTEYRIYQSWIGEFTLQDWLEHKGKHSYTQPELLNFIQNIIHRLARDKSQSGWCSFFCCSKKKIIKSISVEIIKFPFNPDALDKNYDRIYNPRISLVS
jgi:hypothetical protein